MPVAAGEVQTGVIKEGVAVLVDCVDERAKKQKASVEAFSNLVLPRYFTLR